MMNRNNFHDWGAALKRVDAARYCGHSPGHFDKLVRTGVYPQGRDADGLTVWLTWELNQALDALPVRGGQQHSNSCDEAFGC